MISQLSYFLILFIDYLVVEILHALVVFPIPVEILLVAFLVQGVPETTRGYHNIKLHISGQSKLVKSHKNQKANNIFDWFCVSFFFLFLTKKPNSILPFVVFDRLVHLDVESYSIVPLGWENVGHVEEIAVEI